MPLFTLSEPWEYRGEKYEAGLVEASDAVYAAARAAGVTGDPAAKEAPAAAPEPQRRTHRKALDAADGTKTGGEERTEGLTVRAADEPRAPAPPRRTKEG